MTPALWGVLFVLAGALIVLLAGQGTRSGVLAGVGVALPIAIGLGPGAVASLAVFVLGAGALTRLGRAAKDRRGLGEGDEGRRGVPHVLAKIGLPAIIGVAALLHAADARRLALAYTAAIAGAFADTAATEVGPLGRGGAVLVRGLSLSRVPHGTPGAVSAVGLLAGAGAAALVGATALASGDLGIRAAATASASGMAAGIAESILAPSPLGVRLGHHGRNAAVSVLSTGMALAAGAAGWAGP
jgi:uncharacterized protein (TIGR00297 family)